VGTYHFTSPAIALYLHNRRAIECLTVSAHRHKQITRVFGLAAVFAELKTVQPRSPSSALLAQIAVLTLRDR